MFPVVTSAVRGREELPLKHQTCVFQASNICLTPGEIQSKYSLVWPVNVTTLIKIHFCFDTY